ncbi:MAG: MurR/RpiR family transcriptional regulator [Mycoplasmatales bacterium]
MININYKTLNELEHKIHSALLVKIKEDSNLKITQASEFCNVSPSKISKFVRKLGFKTFKEYRNFLNGDISSVQIQTPVYRSNEIARIEQYISTFNFELVDALFELLKRYDKIILFGYGPSYFCADYFAYRLRIVTDKFVMATQDEFVVENTLDENTLLVVISTTGQFKEYKELCKCVEENKAHSAFIIEEYRHIKGLENHNVFYLTHAKQSSTLVAYEKSRSIFFIFLEEVMQRFLYINRQ